MKWEDLEKYAAFRFKVIVREGLYILQFMRKGKDWTPGRIRLEDFFEMNERQFADILVTYNNKSAASDGPTLQQYKETAYVLARDWVDFLVKAGEDLEPDDLKELQELVESELKNLTEDDK